MLTKIKRQDCLARYSAFPLRSYDYKADEDIFFYPTVFKNYILTTSAKTFRANTKDLGIEISKLTKALNTICQYGNLHMATLNKNADKLLNSFINNSKLGYGNKNSCTWRFGKTNGILGRKTVL